MKLKLDENLDERLGGVIAKAGHDVSSVRAQDLRGESEQQCGSWLTVSLWRSNPILPKVGCG